MGQTTSVDVQSPSSTPSNSLNRSILSSELDFLHDQIRKHSLTLRQLHLLTKDDLHTKVKELSVLSGKFVDCNGKQLVFELKDGSDNAPPLLWKGLVRISVIKMNPETGQMETSRELNLKQFLQVYNTITQMQGTILALDKTGEDKDDDNEDGSWDTSLGDEAASLSLSLSLKNTPRKKPVFTMSASLLLDEFEDKGGQGQEDKECCICMESAIQVSLPCTHSFCLACIEQWNVLEKTCPMCREKLKSTKETWVLEDKPSTEDLKMEMQKSLFGLTKKQ